MAKLWQVYESEDMAGSDSWFATRKQAESMVRELGYEGPIKLDETGNFNAPLPQGFEVYLVRHDIKMTKEDVAWSLSNLPNR